MHESTSPRRYRPPRAGVAALGAMTVLAGCSALLPDSRTETKVAWKSYEQAKADIDKLVPFESGRESLAEVGIDPARNPAVTLLTYSDIVQKFSGVAPLRPEDYEPGIRTCLVAGKACTGYSITVRQVYRERVGAFLPDWLNFRREADVTGWSFNALVILVNDKVVYTQTGGEPKVRDFDLQRNPLGPLQNPGLTPTIR